MVPLPLEGFTIGVTADREAHAQMALLQGHGATCVHAPLLRTRMLVPDDSLRAQLRSFASEPPQYVVFATRLGVRAFMDFADSNGFGQTVRQAAHQSEIMARTAEVRAELEARDMPVDWWAQSARVVGMADHLTTVGEANDRVVVIADAGEEQVLVDAVEAAGMLVDVLELYRRRPANHRGLGSKFLNLICDGQIDAVTFTSRASVFEFARLARDVEAFGHVVARCQDDLLLFTNGPGAMSATSEAGLGSSYSSENTNVGSLVELVAASFRARSVTVNFADGEMRLQGSRAWVDDAVAIELRPLESDLLSVLARQPGLVWSKPRLLQEVWKGSDRTVHTVEVAIGRLRKRLGSHGHWIKTVQRRGYALDVVRL